MRSLLLILLLPIFALAQDYDLKSSAKARVKGKKKAKIVKAKTAEPALAAPVAPVAGSPAPNSEVIEEKTEEPKHKYAWGRAKLEDTEPEKPKDPVKWAGQVSYAIRTDLADQVKPRLYQHDFSASYGFEHNPSKISVSAIVSAGYESAGETRSEVLVDENDTEFFMNDFALGVQKSWEAMLKSNVVLTLGNEFPTSPESKREGYGSVTSLGLDWSVPLVPKKISVSIGGEFYYIWNSYEYSPATGDLNKQGGAKASVGVKFTIWKGWYVRAGAGSQQSRYLDGTTDVTYRNSIGTGYNFGQLGISLSTSNGTYLDREDAYIWFVDEYRRTASLGVTYSF